MSSAIGSVTNSNPSMVRMFLRADSAEELVRLQLQTNLMLRGRADYSDIQFADGFWYAWFLVDLDKNQALMEQLSGTTNNARRQRAK